MIDNLKKGLPATESQNQREIDVITKPSTRAQQRKQALAEENLLAINCAVSDFGLIKQPQELQKEVSREGSNDNVRLILLFSQLEPQLI